MYKFKSFTPMSLFFLFYEMVFISKTLFHNLFIELVVELFFFILKNTYFFFIRVINVHFFFLFEGNIIYMYPTNNNI